MSRLFLGNIPHSATEDDIGEWMASLGFVTESIDIIRDRTTGSPRGFCFATLIDGTQREAAVTELNGRLMRGRAITVNDAVPLHTNNGHAHGRRTA
jgi:RNA recognition motif-containing protein